MILQTAHGDINGVPILRQQHPQKFYRALVGVTNQRQLPTGGGELRSGLPLNRVPVFAREGVPQSAALVVRLHVANLNREELRRRYANRYTLFRVVDRDLRVVAQIDPRQKTSSYHDE